MRLTRSLLFALGTNLLAPCFAQDLSAPQWLIAERPHDVSKIDYLDTYGPYEHDGQVFVFEDVHHPMVGKDHGQFAYKYDPNGGGQPLVKDLGLNIPKGGGRLLAALELSDRFIVVFYTHVDKRTVRIHARPYSPADLTPMGEAVQITEIPFTDPTYGYFEADVVLSPDRSRFLLYHDRVMDAENTPLMLCWVVKADLSLDWQAAYKRPRYMGGMALWWSRGIFLSDDGTVWLNMRPIKETVKTYTSASDPNKLTERKLGRLKGERYDLIDLKVDGKPIAFCAPEMVGDVLELATAINTGTEKKPSYTYGLFRVTGANTLEPIYRAPIPGEGLVKVGAVHRKEGGWYGLYRTDEGLTVFTLDARGDQEWSTTLSRYKDEWSMIFEWKGDLFLTQYAQESAINGYAKGKEFSSRDNAFQLIPAYLCVKGRDQHSLGAIYPAESGGERDVINHGRRAFVEAPYCGWFMERSREDKKPGVVLVRID